MKCAATFLFTIFIAAIGVEAKPLKVFILAGTDTNLRSYWSNQSTGLVDDIPGEIMLTPSLWGDVGVK